MKILEAKKIEWANTSGLEVDYEDDDGNKKGMGFEGDGWLEKENGEERFIAKIREIERKIKEDMNKPEIPQKRITKLKNFNNMEV